MESTEHKPRKKRSPGYPSFTLEKAIEKAKLLYDAEDRHYAPMEAIAEHWSTKITNSSFLLAISTLKQFGLLAEEGASESRRFRLTELALDILSYENGSTKHDVAIKQAALTPSIHKELWEKYDGKLPSDANIRVYLVRERQVNTFNKDHVDSFIKQFRATITFAKLSCDDMIDDSGDGEHEDLLPLPPSTRQVAIGSMVQWLANGQYKFKTPQRVVGLSDDGQWVFVEGTPTGLPMAETFVDRNDQAVALVPPANPHYSPSIPRGPSITFPLPGGNSIEIRLAKPVSKKDFERIKKLVDLSEDSLVEQATDDNEELGSL